MSAPEASRGRRVAAVFASFTAPGAGLFLLGRWTRGLVWAAASMGGLAAGYAGFLVHPPLLVVGLLLGPVVWVACLVDTVRAAAGRTLPATAVAASAWIALVVADRIPPHLFRAFVAEAFKIPSGAMQPTLEVGDHLFVDKAAYARALPARGDLVAYEHPEDRAKTYVKRIAGLPGDTLEIREGVLVIDGVAQPRLPAGTATALDATCRPAAGGRFDESLDGVTHAVFQMYPTGWSGGPWTVPEGRYFVLGDNRDNSNDSSRTGQTIPLDHVIGRVSFVWLSWDPCAARVRTERIGIVVR